MCEVQVFGYNFRNFTIYNSKSGKFYVERCLEVVGIYVYIICTMYNIPRNQ